jgi:hypothetical protein
MFGEREPELQQRQGLAGSQAQKSPDFRGNIGDRRKIRRESGRRGPFCNRLWSKKAPPDRSGLAGLAMKARGL